LIEEKNHKDQLSPSDRNIKRKKLHEEDFEKKLEGLNQLALKDTLDVDFLHECLTPPSELNGENNYTPRIRKSK
jgi:hypothetical protein